MAEPAAQYRGPSRESAAPTRYLNDPKEVAQVFKLLRDQRAELQLRFDEEDAVFTAKVLDLQGSTVLIEDLQPRDGMRLMQAGMPFALSVRTDGLYVHSAHNQAHKSDSERSVPFFHVALPKNLLWQQRRQTPRYRLPLRVTIGGAQLTLYPVNRVIKPLIGSIVDLSAGGCRAEFSGFKFCPIRDGEPLDSCALQIPRFLELNTDAEVRHTSFDPQRRVLSCGIEFTEMHVTDRRRLEQFIQTMSRHAG